MRKWNNLRFRNNNTTNCQDPIRIITWINGLKSPEFNNYPHPRYFMAKLFEEVLHVKGRGVMRSLLETVDNKIGRQIWLNAVREKYYIYPIYNNSMDGKDKLSISDGFENPFYPDLDFFVSGYVFAKRNEVEKAFGSKASEEEIKGIMKEKVADLGVYMVQQCC